MSALPAREVQLLTERLRIRVPERADHAAWATGRLESRAHLEPWEPRWPADALSKEDWTRRLRAWRTGWREDRAYVFLIFLREGGDLLGGVSITNVRRGPAQMGSLGYWLLQSAVGQGYMTEAVNCACRWCFSALGLARLEAGTLPGNLRSQNVLERCGFRKEGRARAYLEIHGRRQDHILYARLKEDRA
ncbi:MAG: GNAT family N-acetyltransferase [Hyphomonadaceae bacterium]|nr:GNAT family N-acetyltransferase [Hyphomonadaceae bacterium]